MNDPNVRRVVPEPDSGDSGLLKNITPQEHVEELNELGPRFSYGCYHYKNPLSCHSFAQWLAGWGKQPEKALAMYKYTCEEHNFGPSCLSYGMALFFGNKDLPRGVRSLGANKDVPAAYRAFEHGCNKGEDRGRCCMALAEMMLQGHGSHKPRREDAMQLLEDVCFKMNFPKACHSLGSLYLKSNAARVGELWHHACMNKEWTACQDLFVMYTKGVDGVAPNPQLAEHYRKIFQKRNFDDVQ